MALNAATDQQYHLLDQDGTADDQMDQLQGDHDTVSRDAIGAQAHAEEDASWQAAKSTKKRKQEAQEALERRRGSAGPQDQVKTGTSTFKTLPKLPPLPKDDYKIIIRPNQGLPLRNILTATLAQAIIEACQAGIRDDQFILRINPGSNIAILSTKYEEVADKVRLIRTLVLNGRAHAVRAYAANGDDTLRGVIHGVPMNTSTETLMAHLRVRTHGVEIITARMIGTTKSAAIKFFGPTLPRAIYYYGGELRCYPFHPTIQVCKVCREKGHRADVCPHLDRPICRLCGLTNPTDGHPCSISCASCGEAHLTGDPTCKQRLKPPKPKRPQVQAGHSDKLQQGTSNDPPRTKNLRWFSSEEEENAYKSADDKHSSRPRSRSPGRKPHSLSKKSAPASTSRTSTTVLQEGEPKATAGIKDAPNRHHHFRASSLFSSSSFSEGCQPLRLWQPPPGPVLHGLRRRTAWCAIHQVGFVVATLLRTVLIDSMPPSLGASGIVDVIKDLYIISVHVLHVLVPQTALVIAGSHLIVLDFFDTLLDLAVRAVGCSHSVHNAVSTRAIFTYDVLLNNLGNILFAIPRLTGLFFEVLQLLSFFHYDLLVHIDILVAPQFSAASSSPRCTSSSGAVRGFLDVILGTLLTLSSQRILLGSASEVHGVHERDAVHCAVAGELVAEKLNSLEGGQRLGVHVRKGGFLPVGRQM
ncbi:hypothetical protein HPB52_016425 [Rhipicephalus sanguineus]|uniref:CCHC-type domain-containing protein n=1 Tax=Rhipicephalus sanguineus TaxID=34632 RepID=A0A9D4PS03_RHISA|nr:hypothetical protein HPB52_016425 [Rhipicephalus sanguineus]